MFFVVALSEVTYKAKVVRGSKHNTTNYVWRLGVKLFARNLLGRNTDRVTAYTTEEPWFNS